MMTELIRYSCSESEIENILKLIDNNSIRFESLIEIIKDNFDKDLKSIDYFGQCNHPNIQHYFLAQKIKKGNYVMTTNFDHLIEIALIKIGINKEKIDVIITKNDFLSYANPES